MRVYLIGYPGEMGGANTEALHTVRLWRRFGVDVHLVPTWGTDPKVEQQLDALGCTTHHVTRERLEHVPGLAGSICVGMCNSHVMLEGHRLRALGCRLVWVNCMTFLFSHERRFFDQHGPADAMVFQSHYQRSRIEPQLAAYGYDPGTGYLIRGAFECDAWRFLPRPHCVGEPFVLGRVARPSTDKWAANTWTVYERVQYPNKRALMMGIDPAIARKLGRAPSWATCLAPRSMPIDQYWAKLHCFLPINGGAHENWPRAGLEAMAAGVPIVAEDAWGWQEMIRHGETGFLGATDSELAHWAAVLAHDEPLRLRIARNARDHLAGDLALPEHVWAGWRAIFDRLAQDNLAGNPPASRGRQPTGAAPPASRGRQPHPPASRGRQPTGAANGATP